MVNYMKEHLSFLTIYILLGIGFYHCNSAAPEDRLYRHVSYLAADQLAGRYPTTLGDTLARAYIIENYHTFGLSKINKGRYLQGFDYLSNIEVNGDVSLRSDETFRSLVHGQDFTINKKSASGKVSGSLAFIGYGIKDSLRQYDDFRPVNVNNKLALCYLHPPREIQEHVRKLSMQNNWSEIVEYAASCGARGFIHVAPNEPMEKLIPVKERYPFSQRNSQFQIPVIQISRQVFIQIMTAAGLDIRNIERELTSSRSSRAQNIPNIEMHIQTDVNYVYKKAYNIIGSIKGEDTTQTIVIGAHYDHVPPRRTSGRPDSIRNGADDNASGVAVLLELGRMYSRCKIPGCNVLLICFGAEEGRLMGSQHFLENPPLDLKSIKMMINLDMVGRMDHDTLFVNYSNTAKNFKKIIQSIQKDCTIIQFGRIAGYTDADQFIAHGLPAIWLTTGFHEDVHQVSDETEKINFPGMEKVFYYTVDLIDLISQAGIKFK